MRDETTVTIAAPPEAVWQVLADVEAWPDLTDSVRSVEKLGDGPLHVGMHVRIHQPKLPTAVWTVIDLVENERFIWVAGSPGLRTTGGHEVTSAPGGSRLRLYVDQAGLLGWLVGLVAGRLTRRYIEMEAAGIKRRAEGAG